MEFHPEAAHIIREAHERQKQRVANLISEMEPWEKVLLPDIVGNPRNFEQLIRLDYEREPVAVRQFIADDLYLGKMMGGEVYEKLVQDAEELFAGAYTECILGGGIGYGKTRFMEIVSAYDLYKVTCLRDPARAYGMLPDSNITFVNISVNKEQATKVFFHDFYSLLKASPYFNLVARFDQKLKSEIRFLEKNIRCYPVAASEQGALGTGVFSACIDEAGFMNVVARSKRAAPGEDNTFDQAEAVFRKLALRARSRMSNRGRLPGHILVASSARYPDDFAERLMKQAEEEHANGIYEMFTRRYATWETNRKKFSKETFRVEVGDMIRRSRVLDGTEENVTGRVLEVPMDFYRTFAQDTDRAVRDIGGISVMSIKPFIGEREKVQRMFELGEIAGLRHPFTCDNVTLQQRDPALEKLIPERLQWVKLQKKSPATGLPLFANGLPVMEEVLFPAIYNAHVDLSKSGDATGVVIAHDVTSRKVQRMDPKTMQLVEESKPVIRVDLVLRVIAPKGGQIDIPRIRAIFYELNRLHGMQFGRITFDTFGSQRASRPYRMKALTPRSCRSTRI